MSIDTISKPPRVAILADQIPDDLKQYSQWVLWRWVWKEEEGEWTKPPYQPNDAYARVNDPRTWSTFDVVMSAMQTNRFDGIGFVLTAADPYVAFDWDHCRDSQNGDITPYVLGLIRKVDSYTEVTPSRGGLRTLACGVLPPKGRKKGNYEIYSEGRYVTLTGQHLEEMPLTIEGRQAQINAVHAEIFDDPNTKQPVPPPAPPHHPSPNLTDAELLELACAAKNGNKFDKLFKGNWEGDYPSQSEADEALCFHLAFWTGKDAMRMDALFRQSGLSRSKWDERHFTDGQTYGQATIEKAIQQTVECYSGAGSLNSSGPGGPGGASPIQEPTKINAPLDKDQQTLLRLAALSPLDYGRCRREEAKRLGVPVSILDRGIKDRQKHLRLAVGGRLNLVEFLPAEEPIDGQRLMTDLISTIQKYVAMPRHALDAVVLWVVRSHAHNLFDVNPRLVPRSPEKRCGKTTLLEVLEHVVPKALLASNITPSAIFRVIEAEEPTLLIDELDSFLDAHEELRGILNSGHRRAGAKVIRTVGDAHEPHEFSTWCPMVFAAIGRLPGTLEDRSIIIPMRRRAPGESLQPLRWSGSYGVALRETLTGLARGLVRWVDDHADDLLECEPTVPLDLHDRVSDNWFPLLAIAEVLGGEWPERARKAALWLLCQGTTDSDSDGVQLLADVRKLFENSEVDRLGSQSLCDRLALLEEQPWGDWERGKPLSPNQLARLLRPFAISSRNLRQPDGRVLKGYSVEDFQDAFARYLPSLAESTTSNRYTATSRSSGGDEPLFQTATEEGCSASQNGLSPAPDAGCSGVADRNLESGEEGDLVFEEADHAP